MLSSGSATGRSSGWVSGTGAARRKHNDCKQALVATHILQFYYQYLAASRTADQRYGIFFFALAALHSNVVGIKRAACDDNSICSSLLTIPIRL